MRSPRKIYVVEELVQVAYSLESEDARKREFKALVEAAEELGANRLKVLTWKESERARSGDRSIEVVPLAEWLSTPPSEANP